MTRVSRHILVQREGTVFVILDERTAEEIELTWTEAEDVVKALQRLMLL